MNTTVDGEFQKFSVAGGAYIREHFFGPDPRLRRMVEHLHRRRSREAPARRPRLPQGLCRVQAATELRGAPTVILAKTVKGWTLGPGVEARNITHQAKKLSESGAAHLPRSPGAADPGQCISRTRRTTTRARSPRRSSTSTSGAGRSEVRCRSGSCAPRHCPRRSRRSTPSSTPAARRRSRPRWRSRASCATSSGTRISARTSSRSSRTRRGPSAWTRSSTRSASTPSGGQRYEPVDSELVMKYREASDGQVLEEGITEAGSMASFTAAATSYATLRPPDDPVLHLLLDVRVPADRRPDLGPRRRRGPAASSWARPPVARRWPARDSSTTTATATSWPRRSRTSGPVRPGICL